MAAPLPVVRFPIYAAVRTLGIAVTIVVLIWIIHYREGLALISDNKDLICNAHPVFMVIGPLLLNGEGMLAYKTISGRKSMRKFVHLFIQFLAYSLGMIGLWASWKYHIDKGLDKFYSLHSWLGLAFLLLFTIQWATGFARFWYPGSSRSKKASLLPWHLFFGVYIYALAIISCITGILEKATFLQTNNIISHYSNEAFLANSLGFLIVLLGGLVIFVLVSPTTIGKSDVLKRIPV